MGNSKKLTIPASELRIEDHIINYGTAKTVAQHSKGLNVIVDLDYGRSGSFSPTDLLTIERHEPEVTERWFIMYADDSVSEPWDSYEEAMALRARSVSDGLNIFKITRHDGVLHAVEIVGAPHD